jgi:hypothetical protein
MALATISGGLSRPDVGVLEAEAETAVDASAAPAAALIVGSKTAGDFVAWSLGVEMSMSGAWPANRHPKIIPATCMAIDSADG